MNKETVKLINLANADSMLRTCLSMYKLFCNEVKICDNCPIGADECILNELDATYTNLHIEYLDKKNSKRNV